jgi:hypothetical protein
MNIIDRIRDEYARRGTTMTLEDLLQALPTKNDIANALGAQPRPTMAQDATSVLGLFGTGMIIGAGLALLFAPKPGQELRKDIADKVNAGMEQSGLQSHSAETHGSHA